MTPYSLSISKGSAAFLFLQHGTSGVVRRNRASNGEVLLRSHASPVRSPLDSRHYLRQPCIRVTDVRVLEHRRIRDRLAPRPFGQSRRRWSRSGDDRSDRCSPRRPHQPSGPGYLERRPHRAAGSYCSLRARARQCRRDAGGACRTQSQHLPAVGREWSNRGERWWLEESCSIERNTICRQLPHAPSSLSGRHSGSR